MNKRTLPVSVIIPIHNGVTTLERCVRSINTGLWPQEIIVVDDASVDESVQLAVRLATVYSNIKLICRSENGGAADARRDGFYAAACDHVAFVDADDYLEDGALDEAYNTLVDTASDMCILQLWRTSDDREFEFIDLSKVKFPITGEQAAELTLGSWSIHPLGVAKKEVYLRAYAGFSAISMNADELITRLAFVNARQVVSCTKRYYYVINPLSTTNTIHSRRLSVLDSDIWLLKFCKAHGFKSYRVLLRTSMNDMWALFRLRNEIGLSATIAKLRCFTFDVCFVPGFVAGISGERKALIKFLLVGLYCRIPVFRKW